MNKQIKYLIAAICCIFNTLSFAQSEINSLKAKLSAHIPDSLRLETYCLLAKNYRHIDKTIAKRYIDSVQMFVDQLERTNKPMHDYHFMYKANSLTTLANIAYDVNDLDESVRINLECVKIYEKLNLPTLISVSLNNIGAIFIGLGKHKDAVRYLSKALAHENSVLKTIPDNKALEVSAADTYINLGGVYAKMGQTDSSIYCYEKALSLYSKNDNIEGVASSYNGLVNGYRMRKEFNKAIAYSQKALEMFLELKSEKEVTYSYLFFSDVYFDMKDYKRALQYCDSVEKIASKNSYLDNLMYIFETKTMIYDSLNDTRNEVKYLKKFTKLKDSLNQVNNGLAIEELKTQYETEKKENEIVKLSTDNKIQELQLEKDAATKTRLWVILVSTVIVVLLLVWLAFFLSKTNRKLQDKNIEIQKQGEQLSEQSKLISKYQSQMNPHFVFNALNSIQGSVLNDDKDNTIKRLQLLSQLMRQTLNNSENDTISLDTEVNYLKTYVEFEKQKFKNDLKFELNYPEDAADILIPPMMIQPFIENSIKHAGLQNLSNAFISVNIFAEDDILKITIKDNGVGFEANGGSVFKNSHAIKIILSRLQLLFKEEKETNTHFEILSKPQLETGTEVNIYLPLNFKY